MQQQLTQNFQCRMNSLTHASTSLLNITGQAPIKNSTTALTSWVWKMWHGSKEPSRCSTRESSFIWTPIPQAIFGLFYKEQAITRSNFNSCHVPFHFQQSKGSGLLAGKIQTSTKQTVCVSAEYVTLCWQLEYTQGAFCIVFGPDSIRTLKKRELLMNYGWHSQDFKEMIAANKIFPAHFLFAADTWVQVLAEVLQPCWKQVPVWGLVRQIWGFGMERGAEDLKPFAPSDYLGSRQCQ